MPRTVLDTNVLISALLARHGNEARVLLMVDTAEIGMCVSQPILDEYRDVLLRPKFARVRAAAGELLQVVQDRARMVVPGPGGSVSPDPDDTKFIDCAVAAGAGYLVTGNKAHFPERFYGGTEVVSARTLLERLQAG